MTKNNFNYSLPLSNHSCHYYFDLEFSKIYPLAQALFLGVFSQLKIIDAYKFSIYSLI